MDEVAELDSTEIDITAQLAAEAAGAVSIDVPTDVEVPQENASIAERIKGVFTNSTASVDTPKRRGRPPGSRNKPKEDTSPKALPAKDLADGVIVPLLAVVMMFAVPTHLRMQNQEMSAVAQPLARILVRRVSALDKLSPDLVDGIAILVALAAYAKRIDYENQLRRNPNARPSVVGTQSVPSTVTVPSPSVSGGNGTGPRPVVTGDPVADYFGGN